MIPDALKQAESIKEVVQIIDSGGTESHSPEELAASYAYISTIIKDIPDKKSLQLELCTLIEEGAMFDYALALEYAEVWLIDSLNKVTASRGL